jgi:hypothetical protein
MAEVTYPPLDTPKPVADDVWIVDSGPQAVMGFIQLPVRMTVIRLPSGDLWLHSPTRFTSALKGALDAIGPVRHLVAPNIAHWTHLKEWQGAYPGAVTSAAPELRERAAVKKEGLRLDRDLHDPSPPDWAGTIDQIVVPGAGGFREVAFFHNPTRTLLLTDLVVNLEAKKLPLPTRLFARANGMLAPNGKAPAYLRLMLRMRGAEAREAVSRVIGWEPERVVITHGRWFERDGAAAVRRGFGWLVR